MLRRLYFLVPDRHQVGKVVVNLQSIGIRWDQMHTLANQQIDLGGLPPASVLQKEGTAALIEDVGWFANLTLLFVAFSIVVADLFWGFRISTLLPLGIVFVSAYLAVRFSDVPNVHLEQFEYPLRHGEIVLMVDINEDKVAQVQRFMRRRHPEAVNGGVGWTIEPIHL